MPATSPGRSFLPDAKAEDDRICSTRDWILGETKCFSRSLSKWYNVPNSVFFPEGAFLLKDANRSLAAARLEKKIAVGNPMSGEWVYFRHPLGIKWSSVSWTLLVLNSPGTLDFRLVLDEHFYDSRDQQWHHVPLPTRGAAFGSIYCDGSSSFYYLCQDGDEQVSLRVESAATSTLKYPAQHHLIDYRGEVGMICACAEGISVLLLSQQWVLKSRMPTHLLQ